MRKWRLFTIVIPVVLAGLFVVTCSKKGTDPRIESRSSQTYPHTLGTWWAYEINVLVQRFGRSNETSIRHCTLTVVDTLRCDTPAFVVVPCSQAKENAALNAQARR